MATHTPSLVREEFLSLVSKKNPVWNSFTLTSPPISAPQALVERRHPRICNTNACTVGSYTTPLSRLESTPQAPDDVARPRHIRGKLSSEKQGLGNPKIHQSTYPLSYRSSKLLYSRKVITRERGPWMPHRGQRTISLRNKSRTHCVAVKPTRTYTGKTHSTARSGAATSVYRCLDGLDPHRGSADAYQSIIDSEFTVSYAEAIGIAPEKEASPPPRAPRRGRKKIPSQQITHDQKTAPVRHGLGRPDQPEWKCSNGHNVPMLRTRSWSPSINRSSYTPRAASKSPSPEVSGFLSFTSSSGRNGLHDLASKSSENCGNPPPVLLDTRAPDVSQRAQLMNSVKDYTLLDSAHSSRSTKVDKNLFSLARSTSPSVTSKMYPFLQRLWKTGVGREVCTVP